MSHACHRFWKCYKTLTFCLLLRRRLPRESTSERPKVLRARQFFALLTSIYASRHNGVHFFDIATSKSGPRMVCFVHFHFEMCFAPQRRALFPPNHWKNSVSRLSYLFSHLHLLSSYSFSSTLLSSNLSLLSASSLLCFSSVHIVGSLTSKLPSTMPRLSRICRALMAISSTSSLKNAGPQLISCHPNRHTNGEYVFAIGIFLD